MKQVSLERNPSKKERGRKRIRNSQRETNKRIGERDSKDCAELILWK